MGIGMQIRRDTARMNRRIRRYNSGDMIVLTAATAMTKGMEKRGIQIAHEELQRAVYSTPEGSYQRTMALYNAPRARSTHTGVASGELFMSEAKLRAINPDAKRFIYIRAVEFGHAGKPPYHERPYWHPTMIRMRSEYFQQGKVARHIIARELRS